MDLVRLSRSYLLASRGKVDSMTQGSMESGSSRAGEKEKALRNAGCKRIFYRELRQGAMLLLLLCEGLLRRDSPSQKVTSGSHHLHPGLTHFTRATFMESFPSLPPAPATAWVGSTEVPDHVSRSSSVLPLPSKLTPRGVGACSGARE